jgi:hypothetical protein
MTFSHAKLLDAHGKIIKSILPLQFQAVQQINSLRINGDSVQMTTTAGVNDPILILVTVNGGPAPYFSVNHTFKGVVVDQPGVYTVTFSYCPQHFTLLLWALGIGLLLLFRWMGYAWQVSGEERGAFVGKPLALDSETYR